MTILLTLFPLHHILSRQKFPRRYTFLYTNVHIILSSTLRYQCRQRLFDLLFIAYLTVTSVNLNFFLAWTPCNGKTTNQIQYIFNLAANYSAIFVVYNPNLFYAKLRYVTYTTKEGSQTRCEDYCLRCLMILRVKEICNSEGSYDL